MKLLLSLAFGLFAAWPVHAGVTPDQLKKLYASTSPFESIPRSEWIAESRRAFVIRAKTPQAPVHLLVIPKRRVPPVLQASDALMGELMALAKRAAREQGIDQDGFRLIINTHPNGGQGVYHLHIHVLGGRELGWSPGFRNEG